MHKITMLGTGLIGMFYTMSLQGRRSRDQVSVVYSRSPERAQKFAADWGIPKCTTDLKAAIEDPETDVVVIGLPNNQHAEAALLAAQAGKSILCTKPLARTAEEALQILEAVEKAGVFHGYLEDLVYTPKTLKALASVQKGALGKILWARSRETHPGPHSDWFWNKEISGGGAIVDMGCHCIEISRNFIGKDVKPLEVMCWGDTQVHPIEAEDSAVGLVRYASGAIGQFEVSWTFRGGMDLRDEVSGTEGTIWLNHWLRTGYELFTSVGEGGYVAEKAEGDKGWLFPVGDEVGALGYTDMFADMLNSLDQGKAPMETFYDGYVVNAIIDAAYRSIESKRWEPVNLALWRGSEEITSTQARSDYDPEHWLIKEEKMPDGRTKLILKEKASGKIVQKVQD
jgi:predicted dehydrogenase